MVTVLHTPQVEGFFHAAVDSLTVVPTLCRALRDRLPRDLVVVSPDVGRMRIATEYKRRESGTETAVTHIVGDVSRRACLIVDDMISTGGTVAESVTALLEAGARPEIIVVATHGLLLQGASDKLDHPALREVWITDTVAAADRNWPRLRAVSVAPLLAVRCSGSSRTARSATCTEARRRGFAGKRRRDATGTLS